MAIWVPEPVHRPDEHPQHHAVRQEHASAPPLAVATTALKVVVVVVALRAAADPGWANLEGKAPVARGILFPLLLLAVPAFWVAFRRTAAYPWGADLVVTVACLADLAGNWLDLYDELSWFDDWMHLQNAVLVSGVFVALTVARSAPFVEIVGVAIAAGVTASLAWELFEYGSFLTRSTEWTSAYSDTVGDLTLGWLGSVIAAVVISAAWRHADPNTPAPTHERTQQEDPS